MAAGSAAANAPLWAGSAQNRAQAANAARM
jgi:hypothetical protein